MEDETGQKAKRGQGRGSKFFAIGRDVWEDLWQTKTSNRMNLVLTYLVLLAGTGSDHQFSKWSAKACEQHLGIGKPRAKLAIQELIEAGKIRLTEQSTRLAPQYQFPELPLEDDPIFLPVQIVTGFSGETPVLRRVRETGDPLLLRMLVDLYGLIETDATFGVPIANLRYGELPKGNQSARKIASVGVHAVWAISAGEGGAGGGDWAVLHRDDKSESDNAWSRFWERVDLLKQIGAIFYEPWLFDSGDLNAEPLMPLDPAGLYDVAAMDDEAKLTRLAVEASRALISEERPYVMENTDADYFVPLPLHHQAPTLRKVARIRVEADTPGRRLAWKRRRELIEPLAEAYSKLIEDAHNAEFGNPMKLASSGNAL